MPKLRVLLPDSPPATYVLVGERITVGRRPENTIQIVDRSVSGRHAEFLLVDGYYRLHDLGSTNLSSVEGEPVSDFHLHQSCKLAFGTVNCTYDAAPASLPEAEARLTPEQMEKDLVFLRAENQELLHKIDGLQRRIDILSSARLVTGKPEASAVLAADEAKRLAMERDELKYQNAGLKLELDGLRAELSATSLERDSERQAHELSQIDRVAAEHDLASIDKGATQRIVFPMPAGRE